MAIRYLNKIVDIANNDIAIAKYGNNGALGRYSMP